MAKFIPVPDVTLEGVVRAPSTYPAWIVREIALELQHRRSEKPALCPVCKDAACETKSMECGK